nr:hypothetical protein [Tanacetum cinerariifolium]
MAAPVGGNEVARRVVDDLIDFSEVQTSRNHIAQLNALIAKIKAFEDSREVFDMLIGLRDDKSVENAKLIGLNELITQAEEEIEMKEAHLEAMDVCVVVKVDDKYGSCMEILLKLLVMFYGVSCVDVTRMSGVDYAAWYVHFEELDAYVTTGSLAKVSSSCH